MGSISRDVQRLGPEMYQGIGKDSLAYRLLNAMGWQEGQGLGANKQGITQHVKVKKKFDTLGMGAAEHLDRSREWTTGMMTYDRLLSGLKEVKAQHAARTASRSEEEGSGARGRQPLAPPSPDSSSSSSSSSEESGAASSSNESDSDTPSARPAPPPRPTRVRLATHAGRYGKRERAKLVKGYSASDLAAILGAAPGPVGGGTGGSADARVPGTATRELPTLDSSSSSDAPSSSTSGDDQGPEAGSSPGQSGTCKLALAADAQPPGPQWWSSVFVQSGRVGSGSNQAEPPGQGGKSGTAATGKAVIQVAGFREQDQEQLFHSVHDGAVQGKQGLGRAGLPKKVGGARWCGTRTRIESDSDGGDGGGDEEQGVASKELQAGRENSDAGLTTAQGAGIVILPAKRSSAQHALQVPPPAAVVRKRKAQGALKSRKKGKASDMAAAEVPGADPESSTAVATPQAKVKWAMVIRKLLEAAPKRRLTITKLKKRISAAHGDSCSTEELERRVMRKVNSCSKFLVEGEVVRLRASA